MKAHRFWRSELALVMWLSAGLAGNAQVQAAALGPDDFTRALTRLAPTSIGTQFPPRTAGPALDLPSANGNPRRAAFVVADSGEVDANGFPAFSLWLVVMGIRDGAWHPQAAVSPPMEDARYLYTRSSPVLTARVEDVDDDGEGELFVEVRSNAEVRPDAGHCWVHRTLVFDVGETIPVMTANIATRIECQAKDYGHIEGRVELRDSNGDGHRDLVASNRYCPGTEFYRSSPVPVPRRCGAPIIAYFDWNPADDRYIRSRTITPRLRSSARP